MVTCKKIRENETDIKGRYIRYRETSSNPKIHTEIMEHLKTCRNESCIALYEHLAIVRAHTSIPQRSK
jgi:hypothetical protein